MATINPVQVSTPTELNVATSGTYDIHSVNLIGGVQYAFLAAGSTEGGGTLHDPFMAIMDTQQVLAKTIRSFHLIH